MERAISYLTALPLTKSEINLFVEKALSEIESENTFKIKAQLVAIKKVIELIENGMNETLMNEANKYPEKTITMFGMEFEKARKTTYSYNHSLHYVELKDKVSKWESLMKLATTPIADAETGELIEPAHTSVTEYIKVTLQK